MNIELTILYKKIEGQLTLSAFVDSFIAVQSLEDPWRNRAITVQIGSTGESAPDLSGQGDPYFSS
jgi:hypothetical protein